MSLRIEGHAILWAVALLSVAGVVVNGGAKPGPSTIGGEEPDSWGSEAAANRIAQVSEVKPPRYPRVLPELTGAGRTLFAVLPGVATETSAARAVAETGVPVLKGVISDGKALRAVFATGTDPADFVSAGLSETIAGYRIERIDADLIVVASPAGDAVVLKLRGSGELP